MGNTDARAARDTGIAQAAEHADAVEDRWTDRAYAFLVQHAKEHTFFTVEQVRMRVAGILPDPPTSRAWGAVVLRAARAGIIAKNGHAEAEDPAVHCNMVTLWRSLLRAPVAPVYATPLESEVCALAERWQDALARDAERDPDDEDRMTPDARDELSTSLHSLRKAIERGRAAVTA